ncbi:hypothetical protein DT019_20945 [Streptomyces sp. SDr-06]|nr:hypothetical protein DT019_20945 [Streptomyces sp. SDr-06]
MPGRAGRAHVQRVLTAIAVNIERLSGLPSEEAPTPRRPIPERGKLSPSARDVRRKFAPLAGTPERTGRFITSGFDSTSGHCRSMVVPDFHGCSVLACLRRAVRAQRNGVPPRSGQGLDPLGDDVDVQLSHRLVHGVRGIERGEGDRKTGGLQQAAGLARSTSAWCTRIWVRHA